jgi:CheY-like chemotaxis protein
MHRNGYRELLQGLPLLASLGASVRSRRFRLGISQEQLAERAGLHRTYIAGIEGGGRNITLKSIQKLAHALETSAGTLLAESEKKSRTDVVSLLLVEQDAKDLESTLESFRRARLTNQVHVARDGEAALDFLFCRGKHSIRRGEPLPQMVLLNLELPKVSGLEVLRRVKADKETGMIHFIVLASSVKDEQLGEALRLGAATHLLKPVSFPDFSRVMPKLNLDWTLSHSTAVP